MLFVYKADDIEMSTKTENGMIAVVLIIDLFFLIFYFIQFFKESKAVYRYKILDNKSLIDELNAE